MKQRLQFFLMLIGGGAMALAQPFQGVFAAQPAEQYFAPQRPGEYFAPQPAQEFFAPQPTGKYFAPQPAQEFFAAEAPVAAQPTISAAPVRARGYAIRQGANRVVIAGRLTTGMPAGRWWDNPELAARIGLSDEQKKKMDDVFQASRIKLIDLRASLEKEEAMLDPLMEAATPDDSKLLPQIDRVAQARAELEKADARLLLGLRHVLSPQQWQTLQSAPPIRARPAGSTRPGDVNPPPLPAAGPRVKRGPGDPPPAPTAAPPPGGRGNDR